MREVTSAVWMDGLELSYLREQVRRPPHALHACMSASVHQAGSHQAVGEPLMREVIRDYCQPVLERGQLHGEALLATFKPRGYSECIVVVGGEDRQ